MSYDDELKSGVVSYLQRYCMDQLHELREGSNDGEHVLYVSMRDLNVALPDLHDDALTNPDTVFDDIFATVLRNFEDLADDYSTRNDIEADVKPVKKLAPDYELPDDIRVAASDPTSQVQFDIGEPRGDRLDEQPLVAVEGVCQQKSDPVPRPLEIHWRCESCGCETIIPTENKWDLDKLQPDQCQMCESRGPWSRDYSEEPFEEYQQIRLQEPPENAENASNPREMLVDIKGEELIDACNPGDRVTVTGLLIPDESDDSILVNTRVEARDVRVEGETFEDLELTQEERDRIKQLAQRDDLFELLQNTIAPSIHGLEKPKLGIALQMFGGVTREDYGNRKRGQIHILMIGDPGVGKSQVLDSAAGHAPRSVKTVGKGASAAGLTATAVKEKIGDSEEWTLKAGELVLGDKGLVAIDELDKMRDEDESALHEALADGRVSISKADIRTTLNARCSALMVANPKEGRFNPNQSLAAQFDLPDALLSRCDLIYPLQDTPDEEHDGNVADSALDSVWGDGPGTEQVVADGGATIVDENGVIVDDLLPKYVAYARRNFNPSGEAMKEKIKEFYLDIRGLGDDQQISITPRTISAVRRLSEASARARLRDTVTEEDVERAIELVMDSLNRTIYDDDEGYNVDRIENSSPSKSQDKKYDETREIINEIEEAEEHDKGAPFGKVTDTMKEAGIKDPENIVETLRKKGELYEPVTGHLRVS